MSFLSQVYCLGNFDTDILYCNMAVAKLTMQGSITISNNIAIIQ